ncbi:hypothetical protein [Fusobacterium gastrosuis]|uniref:hypothetical protein n=1 Tax=Fusobacterium gastrosuis TaxID=1755100 RepID=UPI0029774535|nr:hypothetical protein [Fusobacteriaceae bacterium]MDY5713664.1 hypothetical protein [Fusobacterium gastrosuis]
MESKRVMMLVRILEEKGYLKLNSKMKKDSLISKLSELENKLSFEEFERFENLIFSTLEAIEDDYFELGRLVGEILESE